MTVSYSVPMHTPVLRLKVPLRLMLRSSPLRRHQGGLWPILALPVPHNRWPLLCQGMFIPHSHLPNLTTCCKCHRVDQLSRRVSFSLCGRGVRIFPYSSSPSSSHSHIALRIRPVHLPRVPSSRSSGGRVTRASNGM